MISESLSRLIGALAVGVLTLGIILGSTWLAQIDPELVVTRPTRVARIPTPTLYPTLPAETPVMSPTPGVSPTPASPLLEQCDIPEGWMPHRVQAGETLFTLAWRAHTSAYLLMQANCLSAIDVPVGDTLYLPPSAFMTPTPEAYVCGPPPTWRIYYVQPGDTLFRLALNYGTTIEQIRQANCLVNYTLYLGQALYLPPVAVIMPTRTLIPTPFITGTPAPTFTPTPGVTEIPSITPTFTVTATATLGSTPTLTWTPSPTITSTPEGTPTAPSGDTPTAMPTPTPSAMTPTITAPAVTPTASATVPGGSPTATPTGITPPPTPTAQQQTPTITLTPPATMPAPSPAATATPLLTASPVPPTLTPTLAQ